MEGETASPDVDHRLMDSEESPGEIELCESVCECTQLHCKSDLLFVFQTTA